MEHVEIKVWLDKMRIENYVIKPDGTVDVNGYVRLSGESLTSIPVQFGIVTGSFNCSNNELTSLAGCPSSVGGYFSCDANNLTSLAGCPSSVSGDFYCYRNPLLTSLEGIADQIRKIDGSFFFDDKQTQSHVLGLMLIDGLKRIACSNKWAKILNKCLREGKDIYEAQTMLVEADLEAFAQL